MFSSLGLWHLTGSPAPELPQPGVIPSPALLPAALGAEGIALSSPCLAPEPTWLFVAALPTAGDHLQQHSSNFCIPRLHRLCSDGIWSTEAPPSTPAPRAKDGAINDRTNIQTFYPPSLPGSISGIQVFVWN